MQQYAMYCMQQGYLGRGYILTKVGVLMVNAANYAILYEWGDPGAPVASHLDICHRHQGPELS